jgi:hypothetical protein
MNWVVLIVLGFLATTAFTIIMELAIGLRFTRMNIPFILGALFSPNRSKANVYGILLHFLVGPCLAFVYFWIMYALGWLSIWFGLILGIFQGIFLVSVGCAILPACHHRMTNEEYGPQAAKLLEPPGFLGMNYGFFTPIVIVIAHAVYGLCVGAIAFF